MTGTTIAQAIPIAVTPILTRIYTPEDFGVLALFIGISTIFGSIVNGRYELAIMLPVEDDDAINIAALGGMIAICFSFIMLLIIVLFNERFVELLEEKNIKNWLYFIPFTVLILGIYNILNYLNTRKKNYKDIGKTRVYKAVLMPLIQIPIGLFKNGSSGLIIGTIISNIIANYILIRKVIKRYKIRSVITLSNMIRVAFRYSHYPKCMMPATFLNNISGKIIQLSIPAIYSMSMLGHYFLVQRVLAVPASLIGSSVSQVFFQNLSVLVNNRKRFRVNFWKVFFILSLFSFIFFTVLYIFLIDIFTAAFGDEWSTAADLGRILIPLIAIQFIVSPLTIVNQALENTSIILLWQIMLFICYSLILFYAYYNELSFEVMLETIVFVISTCYIIYLFLIILSVEHKKY